MLLLNTTLLPTGVFGSSVLPASASETVGIIRAGTWCSIIHSFDVFCLVVTFIGTCVSAGVCVHVYGVNRHQKRAQRGTDGGESPDLGAGP